MSKFNRDLAINRLLGTDDTPFDRDKSKNILVVLSGGQDSATCLAGALGTRDASAGVHAITFDYGQKHSVELECARELGEMADSWKLIDCRMLGQLAPSALTGALPDVNAPHPLLAGRPASFVPNRNAAFLTLAHAYAIGIGCDEIWTGVCQTDYSGYPDCRRDFIDALEKALSLGSETSIPIVTPLMHMNKAQTWALASMYAFENIVARSTHTCYNGNHVDMHDWGYGCDACGACELRKKGFNEFIKAGTI